MQDSTARRHARPEHKFRANVSQTAKAHPERKHSNTHSNLDITPQTRVLPPPIHSEAWRSTELRIVNRVETKAMPASQPNCEHSKALRLQQTDRD